jgi:hypothetical protein
VEEKLMRVLTFIPALLLVGSTALSAWAADLTKIDRTLTKEPAYQGTPKYCLLVFGPEAKTRVWLVLDGEVLYVDRNGNGNLTEKGKQARLMELDGQVTERARGIKHTALRVIPQKDGGMVVSLMAEGKYRQRSTSVTFARRPQEAPVLHFNGPVSVRFSWAVQEVERAKIEPPDVDAGRKHLLLHLGKDIPVPGERRQDRPVPLSAVLGTPGLGEGTFVTYKALDILGQPNERIAVEVTFPNRDATGKPILAKGFLQPDS